MKKNVDFKFFIIKKLHYFFLISYFLSCILIFNFHRYSLFDLFRNTNSYKKSIENINLDNSISFNELGYILAENSIYNIRLIQHSKEYQLHPNKALFDRYISFQEDFFNDFILLISMGIFGLSILITLGLYTINKSSKKLKEVLKYIK